MTAAWKEKWSWLKDVITLSTAGRIKLDNHTGNLAEGQVKYAPNTEEAQWTSYTEKAVFK